MQGDEERPARPEATNGVPWRSDDPKNTLVGLAVWEARIAGWLPLLIQLCFNFEEKI